MKTLIVIVCLIPFLSACSKSLEDTKGNILAHAPTGEVSVKITNTIIKVDFSLDENMRGVISSEIGQDKIENIKTREKLISYYKTLPPYFQPGYSSMSDNNHYVFSKAEYLLAQECFRDDCSSQARRDILETAVDKQKHKFGVPYTSPSFTRRTGTFLIAVILLKEGDNSFIQSLISNTDLQKSLLCLNHDMWMDDEEFNNMLIQYAEDFLTKK
jgi:hypothetical protein